MELKGCYIYNFFFFRTLNITRPDLTRPDPTLTLTWPDLTYTSTRLRSRGVEEWWIPRTKQRRAQNLGRCLDLPRNLYHLPLCRIRVYVFSHFWPPSAVPGTSPSVIVYRNLGLRTYTSKNFSDPASLGAPNAVGRPFPVLGVPRERLSRPPQIFLMTIVAPEITHDSTPFPKKKLDGKCPVCQSQRNN